MKKNQPHNLLFKIIGGISLSFGTIFLVPDAVDANVCSLENPSTISTDGCYKTPDRYVITIYEMGLCTSAPLSGTNFDDSTCTATLSSSDGIEVNAAAGTTATLSGGTSLRPPTGSYPHAYVKMKNTFGLKGTYELASSTWCSQSDGTATESAGCTATSFTQTLKSFDGSCSSPYDAEDAMAEESLTEGTMKARLTNNSYTTVTTCTATRLIGSLALNNPVVIADTTSGLEVQFTVTNSGMTVIPDGGGDDVSLFSSGPFQAVFNLY